MARSRSLNSTLPLSGLQFRSGTLGAALNDLRSDVDTAFVSLEAEATNKPRFVDTVQTATISNDDTEQVLFTQVIPAGSWNIGDYVQLRTVNEVVGLVSGELRQRAWIGSVGGTQLVTGYLPRNAVGLTGFEYNWFNIVDTGAGPTAARLVGARFTGIDVVVDVTVEQTVYWTGQMTVADPGNQYRGLSANLIVL